MPGYLEIFAGHPDPACESNECARPPARTLVDDVRDESGADDAAVITSWPSIARAATADPSGLVMSAGRKLVGRADALRADASTAALLDRGARAKGFPGEGDYRPDAFTSRIALHYLADARPRFLFVGLGDADEYGHRNDYHGYLEAVHASDAFLGDLLATLDTMGERGRHTTVLVTADHGRAYSFRDHGGRYPESGRVWLVAAGADVRGHGLVAASHRHTLSDIAPTVRALLGMSGPGQPIRELLGAGTLGVP
jgi:Metalloenzyme superfamily